MKKFLTFLLCLGFALSFAACRKDDGTSEETSSSSAAEQSSEVSSIQSSEDTNESSSESSGTETSIYTVTAGYGYGCPITNQATMLYNDSTLFFELPEGHGEVVAGDTFTIEYTGELRINEMYPSETYVLNGEIVSVTAQQAETVALICQAEENETLAFYLYNDGVVGEKVKIANRPQYYLTNDGGEIGYEELTTAADNMVFYGTYSPVNGYSETDGYRLSGLYSWNPREE